MQSSEIDLRHIRSALDAARQGEGAVEPNPMVGCVIARGEQVVAKGFHRKYGFAHAEIDALNNLSPGSDLSRCTMYVTLEPCCHTGKTPPCTEAILAAGISRVVVSMEDPFPEVAGKGIEQLRAGGVEVVVGLGSELAGQLIAPYCKRQQTGMPWILAKWAMTLDGKLATATGDSQWISNPASREIVHQLRGRMDGIVVGSGTAVADNPTLTARPAGLRKPARIVVDSQARIAELPNCKLLETVDEAPVIVMVNNPPAERVKRLESHGVEVLAIQDDLPNANDVDGNDQRLSKLFLELGQRGMTNVLVEGGSGLLGRLFDARLIDEVHAFVAPKIAGGATALSPIGGKGVSKMAEALELFELEVQQIDSDAYFHGRLK